LGGKTKKVEKGTQPSGGTTDAWRVILAIFEKSEFNRRMKLGK
jgi:hypothetical protein